MAQPPGSHGPASEVQIIGAQLRLKDVQVGWGGVVVGAG